MKDDKGLGRRDFLKLGGLMALSAPAVNVIGKVGECEIVESKEEYGGFAIKRHLPDDPPYEVDDSIYGRFDFRKAMNPMVMGAVGTTAMIRNQNGDRGFSRLGLALQEGAWTVANAFGSFSLFGDNGLVSWMPLENTGTAGAPDYARELGRWDYEADGMTIEQVNQAVKKAAKLYGASLVGITEVDQRWFYSRSIYMDMDELLRGAVETASEQGIDLAPKNTLSGREAILFAMQSMDKTDLKDLVVYTIELADPAIRPDGVTPATAKAAPAGMLQSLLPTVVPTFSIEYLHLLATAIDPALLPEGFDPDSLFEEEIEVMDISQTMPSGEIHFDDIEFPIHDHEAQVQIIPKSMKYAIVMAFEMDPDGLTIEHSCESGAAVANAYSRMPFTASCLAQFIRNLGYNAIPMGNDTALSVPMAIDAGLGELSRAGYLVTPKYGPRVRLAKVITDMPLKPEGAISFGVSEFCEVCGKCAQICPSGAISSGERSFETPPSGNPGVNKWAINGTKCLQYWADSGSGCSQCIVACPFNKPEGWLHDATRILIGAKSGSIDKIMVKLDDLSGYGKPAPAEEYWEMDTYVHIKD